MILCLDVHILNEHVIFIRCLPIFFMCGYYGMIYSILPSFISLLLLVSWVNLLPKQSGDILVMLESGG